MGSPHSDCSQGRKWWRGRADYLLGPRFRLQDRRMWSIETFLVWSEGIEAVERERVFFVFSLRPS